MITFKVNCLENPVGLCYTISFVSSYHQRVFTLYAKVSSTLYGEVYTTLIKIMQTKNVQA